MNNTMRRSLIRAATGLPAVPDAARRYVLRQCQITIGTRTEITRGCTFTPGRVSVGDRSFINFSCTVDASAPITIGDNVSIGYNVALITSTHRLAGPFRRAAETVRLPITIEDGCWLGAGAQVLPGVRIHRGCVVAAGAIVTADCAPNGLYAGVPARRVRDLDPDETNSSTIPSPGSAEDADQVLVGTP